MRCSRCKCTGNLGTPDVVFIACIAGRSVSISCECPCHTEGAGTDRQTADLSRAIRPVDSEDQP